MKPLLVLLFALVTSPAFAQSPTTVTYPSSTDHSTVVGGVALVTRYDAVFKKASDNSTVQTKDCGKPAAAPTLDCALPTNLPVNTSVTVTMVAVGPGGSSAGPASDTFVGNLVINAPAAPGKPIVH